MIFRVCLICEVSLNNVVLRVGIWFIFCMICFNVVNIVFCWFWGFIGFFFFICSLFVVYFVYCNIIYFFFVYLNFVYVYLCLCFLLCLCGVVFWCCWGWCCVDIIIGENFFIICLYILCLNDIMFFIGY